MTTRLQEKVTTMPNIPKVFGDDGGHFYRYYDELADEIDEDLVKSLKAQLDGILIFVSVTFYCSSLSVLTNSLSFRQVSSPGSILHSWH